MWQDWVIAIVQWFFVISLLPSILSHDQKPALWTSLITFLGVTTVVFTFATLKLWAAVASGVFLALGWGTLALQRYRLNQRESSESKRSLRNG